MTTNHDSITKGLKEALAITRGEAVPKTETVVRDGVIIERRENGETTFSLDDVLKEISVLADGIHGSYAEFLSKYRDMVSQTQETMAELYGVSVGTYRHWEQGDRKPSASVKRIMDLSVFDPGAFFGLAYESRELEIES